MNTWFAWAPYFGLVSAVYHGIYQQHVLPFLQGFMQGVVDGFNSSEDEETGSSQEDSEETVTDSGSEDVEGDTDSITYDSGGLDDDSDGHESISKGNQWKEDELEVLLNAAHLGNILRKTKFRRKISKKNKSDRAWEAVASVVNSFSIVKRSKQECKDQVQELTKQAKLKKSALRLHLTHHEEMALCIANENMKGRPHGFDNICEERVDRVSNETDSIVVGPGEEDIDVSSNGLSDEEAPTEVTKKAPQKRHLPLTKEEANAQPAKSSRLMGSDESTQAQVLQHLLTRVVETQEQAVNTQGLAVNAFNSIATFLKNKSETKKQKEAFIHDKPKVGKASEDTYKSAGGTDQGSSIPVRSAESSVVRSSARLRRKSLLSSKRL